MFETLDTRTFRIVPKTWQLMRHDAAKVVQWNGPSLFEFFWEGSFEYEHIPLMDADGDHWDRLLQEHNAFVQRNRHLLRTLDEFERAGAAKADRTFVLNTQPAGIERGFGSRETTRAQTAAP